MKKNKEQKGGASGFEFMCSKAIDDEYISLLNILTFSSHIFIFLLLFKYGNLFNVFFLMCICLIIVSFFSFTFLMYSVAIKSFCTNTGSQITNYTFLPMVMIFISSLLQFISSTLIVTIFDKNRPPSNNFTLTSENTSYLFNYEMFYIFTYIVSIILFILLAIHKDKFVSNMLLTVFSILLGVLAGYMFYYAYIFYWYVIVKKNQLYSGLPNALPDKGPTKPAYTITGTNSPPPPPPNNTNTPPQKNNKPSEEACWKL